MMMQGQLTIAAFDRGTAALEEVGTLTGDLFDALAIGRREGLERVIGLAQRFEEVVTQRSQAVAVLGAGMARGDAFEVQGGNELLNEGGLQVRRQREGLDLEVQGREEKGDGRQPLGGQALRLGEALAGARGEISGLGHVVKPRPDVGKPLSDARHRLGLAGRQVIRVIHITEFAQECMGLGLAGLGGGVRDLGLGQVRQGGLMGLAHRRPTVVERGRRGGSLHGRTAGLGRGPGRGGLLDGPG